jgi:hypothetical protein
VSKTRSCSLAGSPTKKFFKKLKKGIDKLPIVCYNKTIKRKENKNMTSRHWERDRKNRKELIETIGHGNTIKTVVVDRHHKNGPEIHEISDTGIITIFNQRTKKMITQLIARPGQIRRYFTDNEIIPTGLLEIARQHQRLNYNFA